MADGISLLDIPQAAPAELAAGQFVYVVTPDGTPYKADISEVVSRMQEEAGAEKFQLHTQNIASATMLNAGTTPVPVPITRASGENINVIFPIVATVVFNSVAFATNTTLGLRFVGANEPIATCDILGRTATGTVTFASVTSVGAADTQWLGDTDLEIYVVGGDPTAGDSVTAVSFYYTVG